MLTISLSMIKLFFCILTSRNATYFCYIQGFKNKYMCIYIDTYIHI